MNTPTALIEVVYGFLAARGVGRATINRLLENANLSKTDLRDKKDVFELAKKIVPARDYAQIGPEDSRISEQVHKCLENGVKFTTFGDKHYPPQIANIAGGQSPPILSIYGNRDLLYQASVGFCGSRKASEKGIEVAEDCASQLVEKDISVVAGHAAGVDSTAHKTALADQGKTIFVLPEGILRFKVRKEIEPYLDWNRAVAVSEFAPGMRWVAHNAMVRNKTIIGLSKAMIVIEAGLKGGTMEAGLAALDMRHPVYAPVYNGAVGEGNNYLIEKGVQRIFKSRASGRADLRHLYSDVLEARNEISGHHTQGRLL